MKMNRIFLLAGVFAAAPLFVACDEPDNFITADLSAAQLEYNDDGVWSDYLNPDKGVVVCSNVSFSHTVTDYGEWGIYWNGFCPSRSNDITDYSDGNWLEHQWDVMSGGGTAGLGTPFFIAYWNSAENLEGGDVPSLQIQMADGAPFFVKSACVNNTTYAYYTMKGGNAFAKKFDAGDWMKVMFYGVTVSGTVTGPVEYYLADFRSEKESEWTMTKKWTEVNLDALNAKGELSYVYAQMASSDSGQFGMNTPGYFALDRLKVEPGAGK